MNKFFLLVIAIGVAALIGAFVFAAFTLEAPFRNRHELLRAAPTSERTLTPLPESGGRSAHQRVVTGPAWAILRFRPIAVALGGFCLSRLTQIRRQIEICAVVSHRPLEQRVET